MVDHGIQVGLEPTHTLRIGDVAAQHVEEVRRVAEIGPWRQRLTPLSQAPVGGDDRREPRDDGLRRVGIQ